VAPHMGHNLQHVAMLEWLEHDPRPTFILDESTAKKKHNGLAAPAYSNPALSALDGGHMLAAIRGDRLTVTTPRDRQAVSDFRTWINTWKDAPSSYTYKSLVWTRTALASRWAVIFGSPVDASGPLATGQPEDLTLSKRISRSKAPTFDWTDEVPPLRTSPHVTWARQIQWSQTALGPMSAWSSQMRSIANLVMQDPRPAVVFCGPELIMIYNESYIELLGGLHPCMGASARAALSGVWEQYFEPIISRNLAGETVEQTDSSIHIVRNGFMEETYFSLKFIPIFDSEGATVAHYEPLTETVSLLTSHSNLAEQFPSWPDLQ
jgi:hypothetical protein